MRRRVLALWIVGVIVAGATTAGARVDNAERPLAVETSPGADPTPAWSPGTVPTTTTVAPTTTVAAAPTSTAAPTTTAGPTTTVAPISTTTVPSGPDATHARIYVENQYAVAVKVGAGDGTDNEWTLEPGATAGPWDMLTQSGPGTGDGANVARVDDPSCGAADGENYFRGGHTYRLVVKTRSTDCLMGPGPELYIYDLTDGTTRTI